jgi:hypothetical protein
MYKYIYIYIYMTASLDFEGRQSGDLGNAAVNRRATGESRLKFKRADVALAASLLLVVANSYFVAQNSSKALSLSFVEQNFVFPDKGHLYFAQNVIGIKASIAKALNEQCPGAKKAVKKVAPIEVIFEATRLPTRDVFIQIQTEQLSSPAVDERYISKLRTARQVWDFSGASAKALDAMLNMSSKQPHVRHIPTMLTYAHMIGRKRLIHELDEPGEFTTFVGHCYVTWTRHPSGRTEVKGIQNSPCGKPNLCSLTEGSVPKEMYDDDKNKDYDVVMFGYLSCSHYNQREEICSMLEQEGFRVLCLHQVFGRILGQFINRSKIVLNVEYHRDSSLATHRIDPLVIDERVVVSLASWDLEQNQLYAPLIHFSTADRLVEDIRAILKSHDGHPKNNNSKLSVRQHLKDTLLDLTPLCAALESV